VVAYDGWTYSREAIELWFHHGYRTSPVTKEFLEDHSRAKIDVTTLVPNILIQEVLDASLNPHLWRGADNA
jgi:hypothetical protein